MVFYSFKSTILHEEIIQSWECLFFFFSINHLRFLFIKPTSKAYYRNNIRTNTLLTVYYGNI